MRDQQFEVRQTRFARISLDILPRGLPPDPPRLEEELLDLFGDRKGLFAFNRARLQVLLNYYAVS